MQIVFSCANCGRKFEKDVSLAGKRGRCKDCGHVFVIPTPSRVASSTTARAPERVAATRDQGRATSAQGPQPSSAWPDSNRQKPKSAPSPTAPVYAEAIDDPYGLNEVPAALKSAPPLPDGDHDEYFAPPRVYPTSEKSTGRRSSAADNEGFRFFDGLPGIVYFVLFVLLAGGAAIAFSFPAAIGGYVAGGALVVAFGLMCYGLLGMIVIPFCESVSCGLMNLFVPFYGLYYLLTRHDAMKGAFLANLSGIAIMLGMAITLPAVVAVRKAAQGGVASNEQAAPDRSIAPPQAAGPQAEFAPGTPPGFRGRGFVPPDTPRPPAPPPGVQPSAMTNSITVIVTGISDQSAGKAFGDKLTELVGKVSGGFQLSGTGGARRSTYTISMRNALDVKAFADQITWASVTRVSGQTIEIDASAQ